MMVVTLPIAKHMRAHTTSWWVNNERHESPASWKWLFFSGCSHSCQRTLLRTQRCSTLCHVKPLKIFFKHGMYVALQAFPSRDSNIYFSFATFKPGAIFILHSHSIKIINEMMMMMTMMVVLICFSLSFNETNSRVSTAKTQSILGGIWLKFPYCSQEAHANRTHTHSR